MKDVAQILLQIESTSSKKEKEAILSSHKENTLLREVLNQIFNPFLKTNIAKKKLAKKVKGDITPENLKTVHDYIDYLNSSSGKDEHIVTVQSYILSQPEELRWLYEAMALKSLKFGFTGKTINKAFGEEFIPVFDVMLAEKYVETKRNKDGTQKVKKNYLRYTDKNVVVTPKLDGNRCVIFTHENGAIEMLSRSGKELEGYDEIVEAFKSFPKGFVYDGEILATNEEGLNALELFRKTSSIVRKKGKKTGVDFHAFDILPISDFQRGICPTACIDRKNALKATVEKYGNNLVKYVEPIYVGKFDEKIIKKLSDEACERQEEGIMVQLMDTPYVLKRTFDILKVKIFESADLRVIDVFEGEGRDKGRLGGCIVDYKGYPVRVGYGYTREERIDFWNDKSLILNKIVEVRYKDESCDKNGKISLRHPGFKTVREDKTEPSYY